MAMILSLHAPGDTLQQDLIALLGKAAEDLGDTATPLATRVHQLRKQLKRARAWAQLLPPPLANTIDTALRDIHRRLGSRRDQDATLEAISRLLPLARAHHRDDSRLALLAVRQQLQRKLDSAPPSESAATVADLRRQLIALVRALDQRALGGDFPLLLAGARKIARRSRKAMRKAIASGRPADFHHWRRWMKYHWFHLRYFAPLWPELLRAQAAAAEHAAEWLGESQDIELLRTALAATPVSSAQHAAASALITREQQRLLQQAASVGQHLHAETPRAFASRLNNYWRARRR